LNEEYIYHVQLKDVVNIIVNYILNLLMSHCMILFRFSLTAQLAVQLPVII